MSASVNNRCVKMVINALCQYFGIKPGELFEFIEDEKPVQKKKK
jgi:hypothetical protein